MANVAPPPRAQAHTCQKEKTETAIDIPVVDKPVPTILKEEENEPEGLLLKDIPVDKDNFESRKIIADCCGGVMKAYTALQDDSDEERPKAPSSG